MFEVKYDAEGNVISTTFKEQPENQQPEKTEEPSVEKESTVDQQLAEIAQEDTHDEPQEEIVAPVDVPQESARDRNTRALRELKEKAERERQEAQRERDEAIRRARELEERYTKKSAPIEEDFDDINIGEDDLAEGKHLKKVAQKIKYLEKKVEQYESQSKNNSLQAQIRSDFPDFAKVVTPENIALLRHLKPRQAALLESSTDLYATAASAYEMIKEYGIYQQENTHVQQKALAQKNAVKPKPTASIAPQQGDSPLSRANAFANGLTPELARQLREEMEEIRRRN